MDQWTSWGEVKVRVRNLRIASVQILTAWRTRTWTGTNWNLILLLNVFLAAAGWSYCMDHLVPVWGEGVCSVIRRTFDIVEEVVGSLRDLEMETVEIEDVVETSNPKKPFWDRGHWASLAFRPLKFFGLG